jgi:hypothetical protein
VLPGIPAFALLLATLWRTDAADSREFCVPARYAIVAAGMLSVGFVGAIVAMQPQFETQLSNRALVQAYESNRTDAAQRLIYVRREPDSADFYTRGKALMLHDVAALQPVFADGPADFFALRDSDLVVLPPVARDRLVQVGKFGPYRLMQEARD